MMLFLAEVMKEYLEQQLIGFYITKIFTQIYLLLLDGHFIQDLNYGMWNITVIIAIILILEMFLKIKNHL